MVEQVSPKHQPDLLQLLKELLELPALDWRQTLDAAATRVALWLHCDKADAFIFDQARTSLVALGTSDTPVGRLQRSLGLDVLPLANGGRIAEVYRTRRSFLSGDAARDEEEVRGIVRDLGARSIMNVPFEIAGATRGVLSVLSQQPNRFDEDDLHGLELIARSVGALAHRAELVERLRRDEALRARQLAAQEIITVLAHDVRNHLQPLSARLQTVKLRLDAGKAVEASDLDAPLKAVHRLTRLTQDLLDSARLEQGLFELELARVDLAALARETAQLLSSPSQEVEVTAPPELWILGDAMRLRQALENVLANGLRHSPAGARLQLKLHARSEPACAVVEVIDQGPGIAPEVMPYLFQRFVSGRGSRGLGLGLFLAERIARAHGGALRVESRPGAGARFWFELPLEL